MTSQIQDYWDRRYEAGGRIWGTSPSRTAVHALEVFRANGVHTVLVPGSGYGRNTRLFSKSGLAVTGIEISPTACAMAREHDPTTLVRQCAALGVGPLGGPFDALYCFNVLHLHLAAERESFVRWAMSQVVAGGVLYFVVFSEEEATFGAGRELEPSTFETKLGRPVHYFSDSDLRGHFRSCRVIETGLVDDPEDHDGAPHIHRLRYLIAETPQ